MMFVTDTIEYTKKQYDVMPILQGTQYNPQYPGMLRNHVNDYHFDEIINWTPTTQKTYHELLEITTKPNESMGNDIFRHITDEIDYYWIKSDDQVPVIVEIGKRRVHYLKNISKLDDHNCFPDLLITIANIYGQVLIPIEIWDSERLIHVIFDYYELEVCGYEKYKLWSKPIYSKTKNQINKIQHQPLIMVLFANKIDWRRHVFQSWNILSLFGYHNLSIEFNRSDENVKTS